MPTTDYPPKTNTNRPPAEYRLTIRLPKLLETDINNEAHWRQVSVAEVVLSALENEFARKATYILNYYSDLRPLIQKAQELQGRTNQEDVRQASKLSDKTG